MLLDWHSDGAEWLVGVQVSFRDYTASVSMCSGRARDRLAAVLGLIHSNDIFKSLKKKKMGTRESRLVPAPSCGSRLH